jgi:hypothetical protein
MIMVGGRPGSEVPAEYRSWRRLPSLLFGSFRMVWRAAPREFTTRTVLQLLQGVAR